MERPCWQLLPATHSGISILTRTTFRKSLPTRIHPFHLSVWAAPKSGGGCGSLLGLNKNQAQPKGSNSRRGMHSQQRVEMTWLTSLRCVVSWNRLLQLETLLFNFSTTFTHPVPTSKEYTVSYCPNLSPHASQKKLTQNNGSSPTIAFLSSTTFRCMSINSGRLLP